MKSKTIKPALLTVVSLIAVVSLVGCNANSF
jgi:hypothetical protein